MNQLKLNLDGFEYIIINPESRTITAKQGFNYSKDEDVRTMDIFKMNMGLYKDPVDFLSLPDGEILIVDDNGRYREEQHQFISPFYPEPLIGVAVLTRIANPGTDQECFATPKNWTVETLTDEVIWVDDAVRLEPQLEFIPVSGFDNDVSKH
jgi:hypothetical protein|tara:strand:- start:293 stop:748 length:456 start_codon:yes stop_codon:yes gene_type:complete